MVSELINKYIWLIQTLLKSGNIGLTLSDIQNKWYNRWGSKYSRKTFNNHKNAIAEIFNIEISCNRSFNTYFIDNQDNLTNSDSAWLINSFTVNSLLNMSRSKLKGRVDVEDIPSGQKYLTTIMDAMLENRELEIVYKKYDKDFPETLNIQPYAVKEFKKRWYLLAFCIERKDMRVYGLDRILSIKFLENFFKIDKNFDVAVYFNSSYGIYNYSTKNKCNIYLSTNDIEAKYIKDLPIHHSQEEISKLPNGIKSPENMNRFFRLSLIPNKNFIMEICKYGNRLKILAPDSLVADIKNSLESAYKLYED